MKWDEMTMRQKGEVMQMMIRHGITDLNEIRNTWNHKFGMGGTKDGEDEPPQHPLRYAAVKIVHMEDRKPDYRDIPYTKDNRGHGPDAYKLPNHPTFSVESQHPEAMEKGGKWGPGYRSFEMSDWQMENPNNTIFGLYTQGDGGVVPTYRGARVLPEITVTPDGSYVYDAYNGDRLYFPNGGYMPSGIEWPIYGYGGHLYDGRNPNGQQLAIKPVISTQDTLPPQNQLPSSGMKQPVIGAAPWISRTPFYTWPLPQADSTTVAEKQENIEELNKIADKITYLENPDSVGFDPVTRMWSSPTGKGYDHNQIGIGLDKGNKLLTVEERKPDAKLPEERERELRYSIVAENEQSYKNRITDAIKAVDGFDGTLSPAKKFLLHEIIYKNRGKTIKWWSENARQFINATDDEAKEMVKEMHKKYFNKTYKERNRNLDRYWDEIKKERCS